MHENLSALSFILFKLNVSLLKYKQNYYIDVIYRKTHSIERDSFDLEDIINEAEKAIHKVKSLVE